MKQCTKCEEQHDDALSACPECGYFGWIGVAARAGAEEASRRTHVCPKCRTVPPPDVTTCPQCARGSRPVLLIVVGALSAAGAIFGVVIFLAAAAGAPWVLFPAVFFGAWAWAWLRVLGGSHRGWVVLPVQAAAILVVALVMAGRIVTRTSSSNTQAEEMVGRFMAHALYQFFILGYLRTDAVKRYCGARHTPARRPDRPADSE